MVESPSAIIGKSPFCLTNDILSIRPSSSATLLELNLEFTVKNNVDIALIVSDRATKTSFAWISL